MHGEQITALPHVKDYDALPAEEVRERAWAARQALGERLTILVHHYQSDEVMQFADFRGDSLELSRLASQQSQAEYILFCGVDFMAESAAMLCSSEQTVLMAVEYAPCPMAAMADAASVAAAWHHLEGLWGPCSVLPIVYQNSSAEVKAFCGAHGGAVCTSSNAGAVMSWALKEGKHVLFVPDRYLGTNSALALGLSPDQVALWNRRSGLLENAPPSADTMVVVWDGFCNVHTAFRVEDVEAVRHKHPKMNIIVHPECPVEVVQAADAAGSTSFIVREVENAGAGSEFAIGTEHHLVQRLAHENPSKTVIPLRQSTCVAMSRTTLSSLCYTLEKLATGEVVNLVQVPESIAQQARTALQRMLEIK